MTIGTWIIRNERDRGFALAAVMKAKLGLQVKISKPTRSNEQNRLLHALLGDLADQLPWPKDTGEIHDVEWWKRRMTLGWILDLRRQKKGEMDVEIVTDLEEGGEFGLLLPHTSDLTTEQCSSLTEWIYAFGAQNGVTFSEPKKDDAPPGEDEGYEAYR